MGVVVTLTCQKANYCQEYVNMHEYSIVQALIEQCDDLAKENETTKILKVIVKIGILSGVEVDLFASAYEVFKEKTICEASELVINMQPLVIKCFDCSKESTLDNINFKCPNCKSLNVQAIDGEDMYLMSLEME